LVFLFLPSLTKDKLFSQFSPTFTLKDGEPYNEASSCKRLGLSPLLDLKLRLGEGTGAVLAMSIIEAALHAHCEMATFEEAGVSTLEEK
jgi:hypothetical protein